MGAHLVVFTKKDPFASVFSNFSFVVGFFAICFKFGFSLRINILVSQGRMHHSSVKFQLGEIAYITFKSLVKMLHVFAGVFSDGEQTAKIVCSHSAVLDPEKKFERLIFPTKYL